MRFVPIHGSFADEKLFGDFFGGLAARDKLEHLDLTARQKTKGRCFLWFWRLQWRSLITRLVPDPGRIDDTLACHGRAHHVIKLADRDAFAYEAVGSCIESFLAIRVAWKSRQANDLCLPVKSLEI